MAKQKSLSTETRLEVSNVPIPQADGSWELKTFPVPKPAIGDRVLYVLPAASPHANEQREAVIVGLDDAGPTLCVRAMPGDFLYGYGGTFEIVGDRGEGVGYDATGKPGTWRYGMGESAQQ